MSKKVKILFVIFYIFLFSVLIKNSFSYLDPDFGWHLKAGQFVAETKNVSWEENYNYTLEGEKWVDHEWLLNFLSYEIYDRFGYVVLSIIFSLVALLVFILLNNFLHKNKQVSGLSFFFVLVVEVLGCFGILAHIGVRMQVFTILLFFLLVVIVNEYSKTRNKKVLYFLPFLFFFWANLHAGFFLGLFVLWLFLIFNIFAPLIVGRFIKKDFLKIDILNKKELQVLGTFTFVSSFITLLTPYHINYFLFIFKYSNTFYLTHILEWLPVWYAPINYYQLFYEIIFFVVVIVLVIDKKIHKINFWYIVLSFFILATTFKARRNFPLFFVASIPFFVEASRELVVCNFRKAWFLKNNFVIFFVGACMFCSSGFLLLETNFTNRPFSNKKFCESNPCELLVKIKELPKKSWTVYNGYTWGGYFIWQWSENKIFLDGRLPMLPKNGQTIMEEYYDFQDEEKTEEMLERYAIDLVVDVNSRPKRYNWFEKSLFGLKDVPYKISNLEKHLKNSSEWQLLYQDKVGYVYYR